MLDQNFMKFKLLPAVESLPVNQQTLKNNTGIKIFQFDKIMRIRV
jgi:hypothetical protein